MYILLQDLKATGNDAEYIYCNTAKPVTYQWRMNLSTISTIKVEHDHECSNEPFVTLRNLLAFYTKRDKAKFKVLARGKTLQRLFERYPEIFL